MAMALFERFRSRGNHLHKEESNSADQIEQTSPTWQTSTHDSLVALSDQELLRRVASDDDEALRLVYRRYSGLVYSLALRMVVDRSLAEEIVQETFIRVWRAAITFDAERGRVETWIVAIARNLALTALRRDRPLSLDDRGDWAGPLADENDSPESVAWRRARGEMVRGALLSLPEPQRRVIYLAYYQGLTHTEIAERTGEPLGTVKSRLRLALRRLNVALRDTLGEAPDDAAATTNMFDSQRTRGAPKHAQST